MERRANRRAFLNQVRFEWNFQGLLILKKEALTNQKTITNMEQLSKNCATVHNIIYTVTQTRQTATVL